RAERAAAGGAAGDERAAAPGEDGGVAAHDVGAGGGGEVADAAEPDGHGRRLRRVDVEAAAVAAREHVGPEGGVDLDAIAAAAGDAAELDGAGAGFGARERERLAGAVAQRDGDGVGAGERMIARRHAQLHVDAGARAAGHAQKAAGDAREDEGALHRAGPRSTRVATPLPCVPRPTPSPTPSAVAATPAASPHTSGRRYHATGGGGVP